jgi:hypothetical protein
MQKRAWELEMTISFYAFGLRFHKVELGWAALTDLMLRSQAKSGSLATKVGLFASGRETKSTLSTGKGMEMKLNHLEMKAEDRSHVLRIKRITSGHQ